jgi:hypothetical protein
MQGNWQRFWLPCCRVDTVRCALPNWAHLWLHAKPLDATVGQVPTPHCPVGRHYWQICCKTQNTKKTQRLTSNYRTFLLKNPKHFWDPKWTLHSAHRCDKHRKKIEMPRFKRRKTSATFLAIKCWQQTKIRNVINLKLSLLKKLAHICATSG